MAARGHYHLAHMRSEYNCLEQAYCWARIGYQRELAASRDAEAAAEYRAAALARSQESRRLMVALDDRLKTLETLLPRIYTVARPPVDLVIS